MEQEQLIMEDWQVPFMLLELASYAQKYNACIPHREGVKHVTALNFFFSDDVEEATSFLHIQDRQDHNVIM